MQGSKRVGLGPSRATRTDARREQHAGPCQAAGAAGAPRRGRAADASSERATPGAAPHMRAGRALGPSRGRARRAGRRGEPRSRAAPWPRQQGREGAGAGAPRGGGRARAGPHAPGPRATRRASAPGPTASGRATPGQHAERSTPGRAGRARGRAA
jgi:hypothetical protein